MGQAKAENTRLAYQKDWTHFTGWCQAVGCEQLPAQPEVIVLYVTSLVSDGRKVSTIERRLAAISQVHQYAGHESPTCTPLVREVLKGIRREKGTMPRTVDALETQELRRIIEHLPPTLKGQRDQALLLLGFAGALRRSELVGLDVEDITTCAEGLRVTIRRSKTDQIGAGRIIGIPYGSNLSTCPVRAYQAWLVRSGITSGAVFRGLDKGGHVISDRMTGRAVAKIIQKAAVRAGIDTKHYSGHSLRAGHATVAAKAGYSETTIMRTTGHRSERMVRRYIREGTLFQNNSAAGLGL
jgi:site-specific recombinase XerD